MTSSVSSRAHADLALAVYLEPHVDGRRVLLLGEAQGVLAGSFDQLASHLEIIDPAAREPSRGEVPELPFDDESFDLVLVCDVSTLPDPAEGAVRELHRVLARGGLLALLGAASPARAPEGALRSGQGPGKRRRAAPAHVAIEALLAGEFRSVRVLAQSPLAGYAIGELERQRGEEVTVDSSLVRAVANEPERLLGLASAAPLPVEGRLWIETPAGERSASASEPVAVTDPGLLEELRRAEDEARDALHRESDLRRVLESERRARSEAEQQVERARSFERKLLAAEADYDDAVARVRYFESAIGEHEATVRHEREHREASERELLHAKKELQAALDRQQRGEAERTAARAESEHAAAELEQLEQRLVELGRQVLGLEQDKKQHEQTARDLLEELRRLEHDKTASVEHDARVAELEAERDRAVQRSLEAEVAREAAQMRADELRSELEESTRIHAVAPRHERESDSRDATIDLLRSDIDARELELLRTAADAARQRGEVQGLRLRLEEAEGALARVRLPAAISSGDDQVDGELSELRLRLSHTEAALHAMREARPARGQGDSAGHDAERQRALEEQLNQADLRLAELTRELEEADRFAELHAEDAERLTSVESELESARGRLEDLEDELRVAEEELRVARITLNAQQDDLTRTRHGVETAQQEAAHRLEVAERREAERDDARAALAEARSILSQLAGHVGVDENDHSSIVQAVFAQRGAAVDSGSEPLIEALRSDLQLRDARIAQLERWLSDTRPNDGELSS
jgi:hypothetical protein